jgi:hypothetical protein
VKRALAAVLVILVSLVVWFGFGASLISTFPIGLPDSAMSPAPLPAGLSVAIWWQVTVALSGTALLASLILARRYARLLSLVWFGTIFGYAVTSTFIVGIEWVVPVGVVAAMGVGLWVGILSRAA